MWDLVLASGGQFRSVRGDRILRTGYDMTAVLALGQARGVPAAAIGAFVPMIEEIALRHWAEHGAADDP